MNILIVDDDSVDRESIRRALRRGEIDCQITETTDVDSASELCRHNHYDLVLLDFQLPRRDGIELLLELRASTRDAGEVIVMMSNSEDQKLALDCIQAGAQDFLLKKEISPEKIQRAILQANKRFELESELRKSFLQVKRLAERDALTGLANRYLFEESFKIALANNRRVDGLLALILFDVDNFKLINDSYGHPAGDALLQGICERINEVLRNHEMFARLGGDEFVILITNLNSAHNASVIAERIEACMQAPFDLNGEQIKASLSMGIAIAEGADRLSPEEMLKYADIAMYRAKRNGRAQFSFFEQGMQEQTLRRLTVENGISQALRNKQFYLDYQPIFRGDTLAFDGVEALIRWRTDHGPVSPAEFIPMAEESNLILDIGRWVIEEAISQQAHWRRASGKCIPVAINISTRQLSDPTLAELVRHLCVQHEVPPHRLQFELTETALLDQAAGQIGLLKEIVDLSCSIALDDFGTGYSSITHLKDTPISTVKLDRSLFPDIQNAPRTRALVTGLVKMLHAIDLHVTAEGIEDAEQEQFVRSLDVNRLQGYRYSRPISPGEVLANFIPGYTPRC